MRRRAFFGSVAAACVAPEATRTTAPILVTVPAIEPLFSDGDYIFRDGDYPGITAWLPDPAAPPVFGVKR